MLGDAVKLEIIEPIAVPDTFVSGVLSLEDLGSDLFRITAYAVQRCPHENKDYAVIVSRHVCTGMTIRRNAASLVESVPEPGQKRAVDYVLHH